MPIVPQNQQGVLSSGTGSNYLFDAPRVGDMTQFKLIVAGEATPKYHPNYTLPGVAGIAWSLDGDTWGVDGAPLSGLHINMAGIDIFAKCVSVQASVRTVTIDSSGLIDDLLGGVVVLSPVLNLALTAFAPTVTASAPNVSVAVPTLGLSTTMHVPSITASTPNTNVDVPKLGLTVTVHAPTITAIIALRVPSNLVLIPGDGIIDASWDQTAHATGYQVRINSGTWVDIGTALTHQFTGLTNGVSATINVRAYNADGVGPMATASATPVAEPETLIEWSDLFPGTTLNAALWTTVSGTPTVGNDRLTLVTGATTTAVRSVESVLADAAAILRVAVYHVATEYYDGDEYAPWTDPLRKLQLRRVGSETIDVDVWLGESDVYIRVETAEGLRFINNSNEWTAISTSMTAWLPAWDGQVVYIDIEFDGLGAIRFMGSKAGQEVAFTTPWITPTGGDVGWNLHLTNHVGDWSATANRVQSVDYSMVV